MSKRILILLVLLLTVTRVNAKDFTFAVLPDTQHYTYHTDCGHDYSNLLTEQTAWVNEFGAVYAIGLGDSVDHYWNWSYAGHTGRQEYENVHSAFIDNLLDCGIPVGMCVGNHDYNWNGGTTLTWREGTSDGSPYWDSVGYRQFSKEVYEDVFGLGWWNSKEGAMNDRDTYELLSFEGRDFIFIYLGHPANSSTIEWAHNTLDMYPLRYGVITCHEITSSGNWSGQGLNLYNGVKSCPNLFMMLCGHTKSEGLRGDNYYPSNSNFKIYTMEADYSGRPSRSYDSSSILCNEVGEEWTRLLTFKDNTSDDVQIYTYSNHVYYNHPYDFDDGVVHDGYDNSGLSQNLTDIHLRVPGIGRLDFLIELEGLTYDISRTLDIVLHTDSKCYFIEKTVSFTNGCSLFSIYNIDLNVKEVEIRESHRLVQVLGITFDSNNIGIVNATGVNRLLAGDLQNLPYVNQDNLVDIQDFAILFINWNKVGYCADINGDGIQDAADFSCIQANFAKVGDVTTYPCE